MNRKEKETVRPDEMDSIQLANNFWEKVHDLENKMNKEEFKAGVLFVGGAEHIGSAGAGSTQDISYIIANAIHEDRDIYEAVETAVRATEYAEKASDKVTSIIRDITRTGKPNTKSGDKCDVCGGDHETPDIKQLEKLGDAGKTVAELLKVLKEIREEIEKK